MTGYNTYIITHDICHRRGFYLYLFVRFFHMISQKPMQLESPNLVLETHLFQGQKVKGQDQSQKSPKTVTVLVFVLL